MIPEPDRISAANEKGTSYISNVKHIFFLIDIGKI
jgi:hypothetical protein